MAANPAILRLLREADQTKLVKTVDDVMKHLVEDDLVYKCRIPSDLVGVHPSNRDGYGVSEEAVHSLGGDIVLLGFSMSATASAVCIEDGDGKVAEFTKKICNGSEKLASVQPSEIKYGSLSCSHTNQFLRAANAEVPSTNEVLQVGSRINVAKITQNDSELKCALKEGLVWTVLKASVATLYPAFPTMLQAAKNAVGQIQQHETEVQLLMRIQALASAQGVHDVPTTWRHSLTSWQFVEEEPRACTSRSCTHFTRPTSLPTKLWAVRFSTRYRSSILLTTSALPSL